MNDITSVIIRYLGRANRHVRIACQMALFKNFPKDMLGKLSILIIASSCEERARCISFIQRKIPNNLSIDVDWYSKKKSQTTIRAIDFDFIVINEYDESIESFLSILDTPDISQTQKILIWCERDRLMRVKAILRCMKIMPLKYGWAIAVPLSRDKDRLVIKEEREMFIDEDVYIKDICE